MRERVNSRAKMVPPSFLFGIHFGLRGLNGSWKFNGKLIHSLALRACIVGNVGITIELAPLGWRRFLLLLAFCLKQIYDLGKYEHEARASE